MEGATNDIFYMQANIFCDESEKSCIFAVALTEKGCR